MSIYENILYYNKKQNIFRIFLVKPMCGLINSDCQVIMIQLLKTSNKESLYAERWSIVFDGINDNFVKP